MSAAELVRIKEAWRFDPAAKPAHTPAMLARRLGQALRARRERDDVKAIKAPGRRVRMGPARSRP